MRTETEKGKAKGKGKEKRAKRDRREKERREAPLKEKILPNAAFTCQNKAAGGSSCDWSHDQSDGRRRCYACGSTEHLVPECPLASSNSPTSSTTRPKMAKAEEERKPAMPDDTSETSGARTSDETMQQLLQEANKMLKGLQDKEKEKPPELTAGDKMKALQQQLDELRFKSLVYWIVELPVR